MPLNSWEVKIFPYMFIYGVVGRDLWHQSSTPWKKIFPLLTPSVQTVRDESVHVWRPCISHMALGSSVTSCVVSGVYVLQWVRGIWHLLKNHPLCAGYFCWGVLCEGCLCITQLLILYWQRVECWPDLGIIILMVHPLPQYFVNIYIPQSLIGSIQILWTVAWQEREGRTSDVRDGLRG